MKTFPSHLTPPGPEASRLLTPNLSALCEVQYPSLQHPRVFPVLWPQILIQNQMRPGPPRGAGGRRKSCFLYPHLTPRFTLPSPLLWGALELWRTLYKVAL